jgi:hypothetical protein
MVDGQQAPLGWNYGSNEQGEQLSEGCISCSYAIGGKPSAMAMFALWWMHETAFRACQYVQKVGLHLHFAEWLLGSKSCRPNDAGYRSQLCQMFAPRVHRALRIPEPGRVKAMLER